MGVRPLRATGECNPQSARAIDEQFATTFHIPVETIRDWEQGRCEPDAAARDYLRMIARGMR